MKGILQSDDLYNTIVGTDAGLLLQTGTGDTGKYNSLFGYRAGVTLTTGYFNSLFGTGAGLNLTTGYYNSLFGSFAGLNLTAGYFNSLFGTDAGNKLTTGYSNSMFGTSAGYGLTAGYFNSLFGDSAGYNLTTGYYNSLFGSFAGLNLATGRCNSLFGDSAGLNLTTGHNNACIGDTTNTYSDTWSYQMNLNNCLIFLPFSAAATLGTVFSAVYHYLANVGSTGCMGFHNTHSIVTANVYSTYIDFKDLNDNTVLSVASGSATLLGYKMFLWFPNYSLNAGNA